MRDKITKTSVDNLSAGEFISDTEVRGFIARRLPSGTVTFGYQYTAPNGTRRWLKLGLYGNVTVEQARTSAKKRAGKVADGADPAAELALKAATSKNTVDHVLDQWLAKHANGARGLRSGQQYATVFDRHVRPAIGKLPIYEVTRADITKMLDKVAENAPVMADRTLAYVRSAFNWWRIRDDKFLTMPIVKGMARTTTEGRKRKRVLDQEEVRDLWRALDAVGAEAPPFFPAFVRTLLLSGCRRDEVAAMHTDEFKGDDWVIPAARYKTKRDHLLPLPATVKTMLPDRKDGFVFSSDGGTTPFSGFSKAKVALDKAIVALRKKEERKPMPSWQYRDLRRTVRTGIRGWIKMDDEIAKLVLGHVITGIDGVYNVYDYRDEKAEALQKWAAYIAEITNTPATPDTVMPFPQASPPPRRRRA